MRVLLAHALTPQRRRIARVLGAAGHEVQKVSEPAEALERCRAWPVDDAKDAGRDRVTAATLHGRT